ncbi:MAG: RnfABCDGE type electron transport complex subunit D [Chloroflexi bacterium]|nr:RnfABCDGE type electron transport complex subunit D [Chloroflexota bacterium]
MSIVFSSAGPVAAPVRRSALRQFVRTPKALLILIFLPLLGLGGLTYGWTPVLGHVASAVLGAVLVDLAARRIRGLPQAAPTSAVLSGTIVAFVLGLETPWYVAMAVGAIASGSKHLLRSERKHIFNPAALALLISIPLFQAGQSWWGALADLSGWWTLLLLVLGLVIVDRVDRFPLAVSFSGVYFGLFTIVALAAPARVAEMFRPPFVEAAVFFACFMLTDPPTAPGRTSDQVWIGALVAVAACVAQLMGAGQAYLLVGLLLGNVALVARRQFARSIGQPAAARTATRPSVAPSARQAGPPPTGSVRPPTTRVAAARLAPIPAGAGGHLVSSGHA